MATSTSSREDEQIGEFLKENMSIDFGDMTKLLEFIQEAFLPEDIFDEGELDIWALENGYVKEN